jgi:hypothetical protein
VVRGQLPQGASWGLVTVLRSCGLRTPALLSGLALGRCYCLGGSGAQSPKVYITSFEHICNFGMPPSRGGMRLISVTPEWSQEIQAPQEIHAPQKPHTSLRGTTTSLDAISSSLSKSKICVSKIESSARGQGLRRQGLRPTASCVTLGPTAFNTGSPQLT